MPYRDDQATLEARRDELRRELDEANRKVEALAEATGDKAKLTRELASVEARLERAGQDRARRLPLLDRIQIASPCNVGWDAMVGDDRVRFCSSCEKNVYNLSAMARDEAERLLVQHEASICVRLFRRADGTVLTSDCPVGVRRKRIRRGVMAAAGAGALAATAANAMFAFQGKPAQVTMGMPVMDVRGGAIVEPPVVGSAAVEPTASPKTPAAPPRPKGRP
jgi:hypothetical protein